MTEGKHALAGIVDIGLAIVHRGTSAPVVDGQVTREGSVAARSECPDLHGACEVDDQACGCMARMPGGDPDVGQDLHMPRGTARSSTEVPVGGQRGCFEVLMAVETRVNLAISGAFASWFAAAR